MYSLTKKQKKKVKFNKEKEIFFFFFLHEVGEALSILSRRQNWCRDKSLTKVPKIENPSINRKAAKVGF